MKRLAEFLGALAIALTPLALVLAGVRWWSPLIVVGGVSMIALVGWAFYEPREAREREADHLAKLMIWSSPGGGDAHARLRLSEMVNELAAAREVGRESDRESDRESKSHSACQAKV